MKKEIKNKLFFFLANIVARPLLLIYRSSLRIKIRRQQHLRSCRQGNQDILFAFWHENMILPLLIHENQKINVLVSQHFDGDIIARILNTFGYLVIRGSSTRGGRVAYRNIKKFMKSGRFEVAFTPDGPTGPRRQPKLGILRLAAETGAPIIQIAVAANRYRRLKSWDRFFLILPFSRCILMYGKPLYVPETKNKEVLMQYTEIFTERLNRLEADARKCLSC